MFLAAVARSCIYSCNYLVMDSLTIKDLLASSRDVSNLSMTEVCMLLANEGTPASVVDSFKGEFVFFEYCNIWNSVALLYKMKLMVKGFYICQRPTLKV